MVGNLLTDKRPMRAMEGSVNQVQMFQVRGKFNPQIEGVATVREADDALNVSGIYRAVMGTRWVRTDQYAVYKKDPKAPLGKEVTWVEDGVRYVQQIPDVPVQFGGKEISLQKAVAMGVYDSIGLLKIEQTDTGLYTVSAVDQATLAGKVRAVDFMRGGWALTDEHGFPLASQPVSSSNSAARYGWVRSDYQKGADGWHGSVARYGFYYVIRQDVYAIDGWSVASGVALVGRSAAAPLEAPGLATPGLPVQLKLTREGEGRLIVEGTPAQLDAAIRLLGTLKQ